MGLPNAPTPLPTPALATVPAQNVEGGVLEAAANKTLAAQAHQIETAQKMGVGQKGAGRRKKKTRRGGGTLNAPSSLLPTASSIPGVDPTNSHIKGIDNLNAIKAAATYDQASKFPAYDPTPKSGGKRTRRKSKHGRRHHRTHRRGHRKSTRSHRGRNRNV
jgi:hypothetical protein